VDISLPLARMGADDDQPMLRLIIDCFVMAAILLVPAWIEAAWRGRRAIRRLFAAGGVRRRQGSPREQEAAWDGARWGHHCPVCSEDTGACECRWPFCQHPLHDYHGLPFDEKLRLALDHPSPENRMMAAEWLGESGDPTALSAFQDRLATESDPRVVVEIALATARIGGQGAATILAGLRSHRSPMVRDVVGRLWDEIIERSA